MTIETNSEITDRAPSLPFNPADAIADEEFDDASGDPDGLDTLGSAHAESPTPPSSTSLRDIVPAPPRERDDPTRDAMGDARPYLNGEALLAALKYVLVACPKPSDDDSLLSFVVVQRDPKHDRISLTACDTNRWHQAYVACERGIDLRGTFRLSKGDVAQFKDFLTTAVERGACCNVRPRSNAVGVCSWEIAFGGTQPLAIDAEPQFAHDGWEPPPFSVGAGAGAAAMHDARHVAKALTVPGAESTRVVRDEVDSAGRRHVTIADEFGHELARAVLVQMGFSEGEPESRQREIPGALGQPDRVRSAPPADAPAKKLKAAKAASKGLKAAAKSKPAPTRAKPKPSKPKGKAKRGKR